MMNRNSSLSIRDRIRSIGYGARGIGWMMATQINARIHAVATVAVAVLGFFLGLSFIEWALVVIAVVMVWAAEAMNTALEFLADAIAPDHNPLVGRAKDVAAGAVLISAIGAVLIGLLVFVPHVMDAFGARN